MPSAHARLQPSKAKTWLNCPGSVALSENVVDEGSSYADEGTACHEICEQVLNGKPWPRPGYKASNGVVITEEMINLCRPCVEWVQEYQDATGAVIRTEQKVEIGKSFGLPEGDCFGTSDIVGRSEEELLVADFKFGYNEVPVFEIDENGNPRPNEQLALYARGAGVHLTPGSILGAGIKRVRLVILQPKCGEPKEKTFPVQDLLAYYQGIEPKVQAAHRGGALVPSDAACKWCKAKPMCPALRSEMVALAQREFAENVVSYSPQELGDLLLKLEMLEPAAKAVRNHALKLMALGTEIPGWKRVTGDTKRAWLGEEKLTAAGLEKMGVKPWEKSLISPAGAEAQLVDLLAPKHKTKKAAKEAAKDLLKKLAGKPEGRPTLAKASDPRSALPPEFTEEDVKAFEAANVDEID